MSSKSVTYIPIFLILSFTEKKFLILMMSNLVISEEELKSHLMEVKVDSEKLA